MARPQYTPEKRISIFWSHVNKDGSIPTHCPELGKCWEWTASFGTGNYGQSYCIYNKRMPSHRVSWYLVNGEIPDGMKVLHKCDNPKCVKPDHLFLGTQQENIDDMIAKGRNAKGVRNYNAKLTPRIALEIRQKYANKYGSTYDLAKEYHVSRRTISAIIRNETWRV